MATRILHRSRSLLLATTRTTTSSAYYASRTPVLRPLFSAVSSTHPPAAGIRGFASSTADSVPPPPPPRVKDPPRKLSDQPLRKDIQLDGCDFEHWLIMMPKPEGDPTRDEIIDHYIKTLAKVVGSEEEARMKIYSVSTKHYYAFGCQISEDLSTKLRDVPGVRWVLPDAYLDVKNKDYGGEPFINGEAVPYDPKYHEEWIRNNARANEKKERNLRPPRRDQGPRPPQQRASSPQQRASSVPAGGNELKDRSSQVPSGRAF